MNERNVKDMRDQNLVNALREHADWWENVGMMEPLGGLEKNLAEAADLIEAQAKGIDALRNELCLKCGNYTLAHEGACNGCRWRRKEDGSVRIFERKKKDVQLIRWL